MAGFRESFSRQNQWRRVDYFESITRIGRVEFLAGIPMWQNGASLMAGLERRLTLGAKRD